MCLSRAFQVAYRMLSGGVRHVSNRQQDAGGQHPVIHIARTGRCLEWGSGPGSGTSKLRPS
jgi:hypothetical protein